MKLSELVDYLQQIKSYDITKMSAPFDRSMEVLRNAVRNTSALDAHSKIRFGDGNYLDEVTEDINRFRTVTLGIDNNHRFYVEQLEIAVTELEQEYLRNSQEVFDTGMKHDDANVILNRRLEVPDDADETFRNRLSVYCDWRYPGLCVGPMRTSFVDEMLSSDPLYLCDIDEKLIDPLIERYNNIYKHRVRPYVIPKYENGKKLFREFPQEQFGIIFAGNFFEYIPLEDIEKILTEMKTLLRPGGTIMFTFNDCDNPRNIRLTERNYRTYTPKKLLKEIVAKIGFEFIFSYDATSGFSWMEIKKPGELETIKGGQSLAQVIIGADTVATSKKTYTQEEIEMIHKEAIALGICSQKDIEKEYFEPGKLELLVKRRKHAMKQEKLLAEQSRKEQEQIQTNIEIEQRKAEGPTLWRANNQGYSKNTVVKHGKKMWVATKDIEPKQRFDEVEWRLVE